MNRKEKKRLLYDKSAFGVICFLFGVFLALIAVPDLYEIKAKAYESGYKNGSQDLKIRGFGEFEEISFITVHPKNKTYTVIECVNSSIKIDNNRIYCEVSK